MDNIKKIIFIFIVIIIAIVIVFKVINNRKEVENIVEEKEIEINDNTGLYTVYDKNGHVKAASDGDGSLEEYLENEDYNPNPAGSGSSEFEKEVLELDEDN